MSAEFVAGRQVVTASRDSLTVDRYVLGWRSKRRSGKYPISHVSRLRVARGGKPRPPSRLTVDVYAVEFDFQGKTIRFGVGIKGAEAERVVDALKEAVPQLRP